MAQALASLQGALHLAPSTVSSGPPFAAKYNLLHQLMSNRAVQPAVGHIQPSPSKLDLACRGAAPNKILGSAGITPSKFMPSKVM